MPKTKTTPRKAPPEICPLCFIELATKEAWKTHLLVCADKVIQCKECHKTFKKKAYLEKHMRTKHSAESTSTTAIADLAEDSESDWDKDPECLIGVVSDSDHENSDASDAEEPTDPKSSTPKTMDEELLVGRIVRKRTQPLVPVQARRVVSRDADHEPGVSPSKMSASALSTSEDTAASSQAVGVAPSQAADETPPRSVEASLLNQRRVVDMVPPKVDAASTTGSSAVASQTPGVEMKDESTQCEKYRKRVKKLTVVKYKEGGKDVEEVHECEEFFNM